MLKTSKVVASAINSRKDLEASLEGLIKVEKPYYALRNLSVSDGLLQADVPVEYFDHDELPGISFSEAGRHMAILGSLVLANSNPLKEKHYYLASKAIMERRYGYSIKPSGCFARAKVISLNKRIGVAETTMYTEDGVLLYFARFTYVILHNALFERKFNEHRLSTPMGWDKNPYELRTPVRLATKTDEQFEAYIDRVEKKDCLGHFHNYPAFPVARMAGVLIDVAGKHFARISQKTEKYLVVRTELSADSLIFVGEKVKIITRPVVVADQTDVLIETYAYTERSEDAYAVKMLLWFR